VSAALAKRPVAIVLLVAGFALLSLGICLIPPAVNANGVTAAHQLAEARREFRRQATLEVPQAGSTQPSRAAIGERLSPAALAGLYQPPIHPADSLQTTAPRTPRRLLLRPKFIASRSSGGDPIS
jgi:hypothetical protein